MLLLLPWLLCHGPFIDTERRGSIWRISWKPWLHWLSQSFWKQRTAN